MPRVPSDPWETEQRQRRPRAVGKPNSIWLTRRDAEPKLGVTERSWGTKWSPSALTHIKSPVRTGFQARSMERIDWTYALSLAATLALAAGAICLLLFAM